MLLHSHVGEQPFTRLGGPLDAQPDDTLIIRPHMNDVGYGESVMQGTIAGGFIQGELSTEFAAELETLEPLPTDCAF